jgi:TatD DNase family protein
MLIDTHTHLYLEHFESDRDQVIQRALNEGVEKFFLPNIDSKQIDPLLSLTEQYPEHCYPMMGLHPGSVDENYEEELEKIEQTLDAHNFYAVGEIGIDLYWDDTYQKEQENAFRTQIQWAKDRELPIVIHCRAAFQEVLDVLESENDDQLFGIFHCFTADKDGADRILALGDFYLGIGGIVTFKNADLDKSVKQIPLEHLVLETDAPFLAPHPNRGKRNESSFLPLIAQKIADLHNNTSKEDDKLPTQSAEAIVST